VGELAHWRRAGGGARGRGLAITRAVLVHCGGRIFALSTAPGVAIDLPLDRRSA
jgi:signal transduction histidine kinase